MASIFTLCRMPLVSSPVFPSAYCFANFCLGTPSTPIFVKYSKSFGRASQPLTNRTDSLELKIPDTRLLSSRKQGITSHVNKEVALQSVDSEKVLSDKEEAKIDILRVDRSRQRRAERLTYLFAAVASSTLVISLAAGAVYYRFVWHMQGIGEPSLAEMFGTFSLAVGAAVGMEFWARWAHRILWHASLWNMHESHHRPREGPFELNDVFAIINAVPAIALIAYGFLNTGLLAGLCFGAGLGITTFGISYMFVHDGLVHRRFPVGPIANVPYLQKVAAAHQLHHADLFDGVPYGLFLGPKELEKVGGLEQLEKTLEARTKRES